MDDVGPASDWMNEWMNVLCKVRLMWHHSLSASVQTGVHPQSVCLTREERKYVACCDKLPTARFYIRAELFFPSHFPLQAAVSHIKGKVINDLISFFSNREQVRLWVQIFSFVYFPILSTDTDISTTKITIRLQMHCIGRQIYFLLCYLQQMIMNQIKMNISINNFLFHQKVFILPSLPF